MIVVQRPVAEPMMMWVSSSQTPPEAPGSGIRKSSFPAWVSQITDVAVLLGGQNLGAIGRK